MDEKLLTKLRHMQQFKSELHGPQHWSRVAYFGKRLSQFCELSRSELYCVQLFAWIHDLARLDDSYDLGHGQRGADYLPVVLEYCDIRLPLDRLHIVQQAITYHSNGYTAEKALNSGILARGNWETAPFLHIVGCCWDADRLDLLRLGIIPTPAKMSTPHWERLLDRAKQNHRKTLIRWQ